jgi:hypothetical protein
VDIPRPADRILGGIIWFQGTIITSRLSEMDSYSQQLASLKAKSGAGVTIYSDDAPEHLPGGAAEAGARRGNLHLDDRQHRGEIHGEITRQSALKRHRRF